LTDLVLSEAVRAAYRAGEDDETMNPLVLVDATGKPVGRVQDGDYVIFYDIRGEREVELTQAFVADEFPHFARAPLRTHWVTMVEYAPGLVEHVAFPPIGAVPDTMSELVGKAGLRQVKIVESEKRVHLTFFLNGKRNEPFPGETWQIIPSREFVGYLPPPEMNAAAVADAAIQALREQTNDLIIVNWANTDVIGHSEDAEAIKKAVSTVDAQLARVLDVAQQEHVAAIVTADHGTVEKWYYEDGSIDTGHTDSPVPFILVAPHLNRVSLRSGGALTDVAPTVLDLLGVPASPLMTGRSLLTPHADWGRQRVALLILDGWGAREAEWGNLIRAAHTPTMDRLQAEFPATVIEAAGAAVGLPNTVPGRPGKTVGNSEVGHMHIGAGRVVPSDRYRIEKAIADGSFFENPAFRWAMEGARRDGTRLHLLGIVSFYSSHGSVEHLGALLKMAQKFAVPQAYVHGMLGRRGEKSESGALYAAEIEAECARLGVGRLVGLIGRFWSLDREGHWERIEKTYRWLVWGHGHPVQGSF